MKTTEELIDTLTKQDIQNLIKVDLGDLMLSEIDPMSFMPADRRRNFVLKYRKPKEFANTHDLRHFGRSLFDQALVIANKADTELWEDCIVTPDYIKAMLQLDTEQDTETLTFLGLCMFALAHYTYRHQFVFRMTSMDFWGMVETGSLASSFPYFYRAVIALHKLPVRALIPNIINYFNIQSQTIQTEISQVADKLQEHVTHIEKLFPVALKNPIIKQTFEYTHKRVNEVYQDEDFDGYISYMIENSK